MPEKNGWIERILQGLFRYGADGFTLFNKTAGINLNKGVHLNGLQSILKDGRGRMWLGFSAGLYRLEGKTIVNVAKAGP